MRLPVVHHPDYDARLPATHRFPMSKYARLIEVLRETGLLNRADLFEPSPAGAALLSAVHDPAYVEQVIACAVPHAIEREIGFEVNERVSLRARLAAAGTLMTAELALKHGLACNMAGGSHHARYEQGAGFCTFNDVAVAARALLDRGSVERVLVIDLDVHQGDGTARIFAGEPRVFTVSMHAARNYPARKALSDLDVELDDGTDDDAYLERLRHLLAGLERRRRPDIVFYNAGVDPHADDRLGRLALSDAGLRRRDAMVIAAVRQYGIPLCGVIGGGYSRNVDALARRHAMLFEEAAGYLAGLNGGN